ncbi:MAG TPA: hypothetical protein VML55_26370 [Planctomycetaceae bacterium]|nr:hypothetical protein [Planctomycetaceae bacterium]
MLSLLRERLGSFLRRSADQPWYAALAASTAVHVILLAVLAWLWIGHERDRASIAAIDSRWQPAESLPSLVELDRTLAEPVVELTGGGRPAAAVLPQAAIAVVPVLFPTSAATDSVDRTADRLLADGLSAEVGAAPAGSGDGEGGRGEGQGAGDGDGAGRFFGAEAHGRRLVYVVDRSNSMNHPHPSEARTRFRRLQFELLSSIGRMGPEMEFFIIFFNDEPHPMPARELQAATPQARQYFLDWMARVRALGRTDPRAALELALQLRPDTIYFLSDGAFTPRIELDLRKIRQRGTVIHTFAFGDEGGRETLEWVAESNGGKYHFVP